MQYISRGYSAPYTHTDR